MDIVYNLFDGNGAEMEVCGFKDGENIILKILCCVQGTALQITEKEIIY